MRKALKGHDSRAGFTVEPTKSRQYPLITKSDLDFADDIALILNHIDEAQCRLQSVVNAATNLRLHLNAVKTQAIIYNRDPTVIKTKSNDSIRKVADFKYLGSWINKWFCQRHENKKSLSLGGV